MISFLSILAAASLTAAPATAVVANKPRQENNSDQEVPRRTDQQKSIGSPISDYEASRFRYKVSDYEWFTKLYSAEEVDYDDLKQKSSSGPGNDGLCEYVSLSMIATFLQLFKTPTIFSDENYEKYFRKPKGNSNKILAPKHKHWDDKGNRNETFTRTLWLLNNRKINLKGGSFVHNPFRKWLAKQNFDWKIDDQYSAAFAHTSQPEDYMMKYNVPIMLSATSLYHNIVIYGYDAPSQSYLFHIGWSGYGPRKIKKQEVWHFASLGFWNIFYPTPGVNQPPLKKDFKYKGEMYSWTELKAMGLTANDIEFD